MKKEKCYLNCKYYHACGGDSCSRCKGYEDGRESFYFTFGSNPVFPFEGGFMVVKAKNETEAVRIFNFEYGLSEDGFGRYSFVYTPEEWGQIYPKHYKGRKPHKVIS